MNAIELFNDLVELGDEMVQLFESYHYIRPAFCRQYITDIDQARNSLEKLYQMVSVGQNRLCQSIVHLPVDLNLSIAVCKLMSDLEELRKLTLEFKMISTTESAEKRQLARQVCTLAQEVEKYSSKTLKACNSSTNLEKTMRQMALN